MIKRNILYGLVVLTLSCKGLKTITGSYINNKNGHEIELLDSGQFIYKSYDGFDGEYYSYGDWKNQNQTIILESSSPKSEVDIKYTQTDKSIINLNDYRDNSKKDSLEILINSKIYQETTFDSNELLYSLKILRKKDGLLLKEMNFAKANYKIDIFISDILNEISIGKVTLNKKRNYLVDESGNKFKKKKGNGLD